MEEASSSNKAWREKANRDSFNKVGSFFMAWLHARRIDASLQKPIVAIVITNGWERTVKGL